LHFFTQTQKGLKQTLKINDTEQPFKVKIIKMILAKHTGQALQLLSDYYNVDVPRLKVGMPKQGGRNVGCYVSRTRTIHLMNSEKLEDPFVVLHEFYHHLRTQGGKHRGTERHANAFAQGFIDASRTSQNLSFRVTYS
jgi:Zn-dependent peptidase ImmA (M78 family)